MNKVKFPCTYQFFKNYYKLYKPLEDRFYNEIESGNSIGCTKAFNLTKYIDQALKSSFYFDTIEINEYATIENMRRCDIFNMFKKEV